MLTAEAKPTATFIDGLAELVEGKLPPDEEERVMQELLAELEKGVRSGEENGWITAEEMRRDVAAWRADRL